MPIATLPTPTILSSRTTWSRVARLTVAQRVFGPLEVLGIGERREIRSQRIGGTSFDGRREVTTSLGGGIGIQIQNQMRFALTYEHTRTDLDRTHRPQTTSARACSGRSATDSNL